MAMDNLWIVVAHQAGVRIFSRNRPVDGIKLIEKVNHPEAKLRDHDISTDRQGRYFSSAGSPRTRQASPGRAPIHHGFSSPNSPHETEVIRFAQELAHHLETGRGQNRFFRLVLVAGPEEMGLIRGALDKKTDERVIATLNKNLCQVRDMDIEEQIDGVLAEVDEKLAVMRSA